MILGIIIAILFLFEVSNFIAKKIRKTRFRKTLSNIHKAVGIMIIILSIVHLINTYKLLNQRPIEMYIVGIVMVFCSIALLITFLKRKNLGKKWIKIHKLFASLMFICLVAHVAIGVISFQHYKEDVSNIENVNVDLSTVSDGTYTGECNVGYIYAKVKIVVKNNKIAEINILEHRNERGKAAEKIAGDIVKKQKTKVDTVSGATNSSKVIMKAVENAIKKKA